VLWAALLGGRPCAGADGKLVVGRFPWFGPHRFHYENGPLRVHFAFRSFTETNSPVAVDGVSLVKNGEERRVVAKLQPLCAPANRDLKAALSMAPGDEGFVVGNRYEPAANRVAYFAGAETRVSLADGITASLELFSAGDEPGPTRLNVSAMQVCLAPGALPARLTVPSSAESITIPATGKFFKELPGTEYRIKTADGAVIRVELEEGEDAATLCSGGKGGLPGIQVRVQGDRNTVTYIMRQAPFGRGETLTARWRMSVTEAPPSGGGQEP